MPQSCNRRSVLKRVGALALPLLVPRHVLASVGSPGANDRIGVGYIGVGRRGCQLMKLPKEGQIVAVADINRTRAEAVAERQKSRSYTEYRKLLEAKDVDAVIIATPDHWHAIPSIHACQAGKDVYTEKPLSLTVVEGRRMVEAARKHARVFQTGSQRRSMKYHRQACQLVRAGKIGKVHTVIGMNYPSPWECALPGQPVPAGLDWDTWCGPTAAVPYHEDLYLPRARPGWISFRPYSGGEMTGWGSHGLDQIHWALGLDLTGPTEITTEAAGPLAAPTYAAPETLTRGNAACSRGHRVEFRYANGLVLKLEPNGPGSGGHFIGERGEVRLDNNAFQAKPAGLADDPLTDAEPKLEVSDNHFQNWFDCIRSRQKPIADVEIGHRSATLCHLGNIVRWAGRPLRWDPEREVFAGDEQANALLDRPRRKGFELPAI